jgi:hypothetical protein
MYGVKPKEYHCKKCGHYQYADGLCTKCGKEITDERKRSLTFWERDYGLEMSVTKDEFAKMIAEHSIKSVNSSGKKWIELAKLMDMQ